MPNKSAKDYTSDLIEGYNNWFWTQVGIIEHRLSLCFWLGLVFGVLATVTAAFPRGIVSDGPGLLQDLLSWLVVVFTTLSTLFNATLLPRYKNLLEMRDTGRIRLDALKQSYEIQEYSDDDQVKMKDVIKNIAQIEADFGGIGKPGDGTKP